MKTCTRCGASEWPCFLVVELCRMCQARRRDEQSALRDAARDAAVIVEALAKGKS